MQVIRKVQGVFKGDVSKVPKPVYGSDSVVFDITPSESPNRAQQGTDQAALAKAVYELGEALFRQSREWSKSCTDLENGPDSKGQFRRNSRHVVAYSALVEERKSILADIDALLVQISGISGFPTACETADDFRACLSKKPEEEKHLLGLWRLELPRSPYDRVMLLAHIRLAMQDAKLIRLICKDDPQLAVAAGQASRYIERLDACPAVRIHDNLIDDVDDAILYEMAAISEGDALCFHALIQFKEPDSSHENYLISTAQHDLLRCGLVAEIGERLGLDKAVKNARQNAVGIHLRHPQTDEGKARCEVKKLLAEQTLAFERASFFQNARGYRAFINHSSVDSPHASGH